MGDGTLRAKKTLVNEKQRLLKYIDVNTQKEIARNYGDIETQRDLIIGYLESSHPDLIRIFTNNYYREVDDFVEFIEGKYKNEVSSKTNKSMGIKTVKIVTRTKKSKPKATITSKRGNKSYTRTKSIKFENKKLLIGFIRTRVKQGKTTKEITKEYSSFAKSRGWETRTTSSLANIRTRNKIKKNG